MTWTGCFAKDASGNEIPGQILTLSCLPNFFTGIVNWALVFAGVVALFFLIWGGIRLIMSGGEKTSVEEGKKTITFAIIGLIIVLLSFFVVRLVAYVTGVECITMFGFDSCQ